MAVDPRGTTGERGYGPAHERERRRVGRTVAAGNAYCAQCGEWIEPGSKWFLGHDHVNGGYAGPEHPECGVREARRRNARHRRRSREWW